MKNVIEASSGFRASGFVGSERADPQSSSHTLHHCVPLGKAGPSFRPLLGTWARRVV